jgi:hypothetical protein
VHTRPGEDLFRDLFWDLDEAVWVPGEEVRLVDSGGNLQSSYKITE